jgi:hypothetical protein
MAVHVRNALRQANGAEFAHLLCWPTTKCGVAQA